MTADEIRKILDLLDEPHRKLESFQCAAGCDHESDIYGECIEILDKALAPIRDALKVAWLDALRKEVA